MAVFTANLPIDFGALDIFEDFDGAGIERDDFNPSHKFYVYPGSNIEIAIRGHDFVYTPDDIPIRGAINAAEVRIYDASGDDYQVAYRLSGLNITPAKIAQYVNDSPLEVVADLFKGADRITGSDFNDRIAGFDGSDKLTGGDGNDRFYFTTELSSSNVDRITDFEHRHDKIVLSRAVFELDPGQSVSSAFHDITSGGFRLEQDDDHILYNRNNGWLFYDADGRGGDAPVHFATLDHHPQLTSGDILMV